MAVRSQERSATSNKFLWSGKNLEAQVYLKARSAGIRAIFGADPDAHFWLMGPDPVPTPDPILFFSDFFHIFILIN